MNVLVQPYTQSGGERTCIRPFMKLACNPLNGELLEQENTRTENRSQQNFSDDVKRVSTLIAAIRVLATGDNGQKGHPDGD
jgi:hypothetical protein